MSWVEVDSSWINALNYFEEEEGLEVNLINGKTYVYFGVAKAIFNAFVEADSKGKFYNDYIKHNYNSLRVLPLEEEPEQYPVCRRFRFYPTPGAEQTNVGGIVQGSNVSNVAGFTDSAVIDYVTEDWNTLYLENETQYKYLRVYFPAVAGVYVGQLREIEFVDGNKQIIRKNAVFSDGWYNQPDEGNGVGTLFDGDILTASASALGSFVYFGIEVSAI